MITRPTVFVLGAGASTYYGFPTGAELMTKLVGARADPNLAADPENKLIPRLMEVGHTLDEVNALQDALEVSGAYSIDRFIETNENLKDICKRAIAAVLLPLELDSMVCLRSSPGDWYKLLVEMLVTRHPRDFMRNKLRIVTFNFDRSLERALAVRLRGRYTGLDAAAINNLVSSLGIIHVHGVLGPTQWSDLRWKSSSSRRYDAETVSPEMIKSVAAGLKIFPESFADDVQEAVDDAFQGVERIVFLGFGFHAENVKKLRIPDRVTNAEYVGGTLQGLKLHRIGQIQREFKGKRIERNGHFGYGQMGVHQWIEPVEDFLTSD